MDTPLQQAWDTDKHFFDFLIERNVRKSPLTRFEYIAEPTAHIAHGSFPNF